MDIFDLTGRKVFITGGSRGIGRAIAVALAERGAVVFCTARSDTGLKETAQLVEKAGGNAEWAAADLANEGAIIEVVDEAVRRLGGLDIVINNAAADHDSSVLETPTDTWDLVTAMNLRTPYIVCREAGRHLVARGSGKVINILSILSVVAVRDNSAYIAAKHGLLGFTRALALEWARKGVQVNALAPGFIRTDMTASFWQDERASEWVLKRTPMGRWGETTDLVGAAVFLSSRASDFMTGQAIYVDGGWTAQ